MKMPTIEDLQALDALSHAVQHIKSQFHLNMSRDEAKANLDTRSMLFRATNRILAEYGCPVTREEIEGALILERELAD